MKTIATKENHYTGKGINYSFTEYNDYDDNGKLIHSKSSYGIGTEQWFEYDDKGRMIHYKDSIGTEKFYSYQEI